MAFGSMLDQILHSAKSMQGTSSLAGTQSGRRKTSSYDQATKRSGTREPHVCWPMPVGDEGQCPFIHAGKGCGFSCSRGGDSYKAFNTIKEYLILQTKVSMD